MNDFEKDELVYQINTTIKELKASDSFYISFNKLSFLKLAERETYMKFGLRLCDLDIFEKFSNEAIKFSSKGSEMIANGHTDWKAYKNSLKSKRPIWEYFLGIIAILSFAYNVFSTERINIKDKNIIELKDKLIQQKELHKSFADSIHSILTTKDSLNIP